MSRFGFFARLGGVVQRRALWVVGLWVVGLWLLLAVGLTVIAPSLADVGVQDDADFLRGRGGPSRRWRCRGHALGLNVGR